MHKHSIKIVPVTVKLNLDAKKRLQKLGKIKRRSTHWLMKEAIDLYLKHEELTEELKRETLVRWEEAVQGKLVSNQTVTEWLDTWGTDRETNRP
jgi:predicted transcriptional regulator